MVVLVGVDGSVGSRAALRFASEFAHTMGARLIAVWSWEYPVTPFAGGPPLLSPDATDAVAETQLDEVLRQELADAAPSVERRVERGPGAFGLLHAASSTHAEALVVGSRGHGSVATRLLGSVSRRVVEHASCPVIIVPAGHAHSAGPVVVGVDGSDGAANAVRWATAVAKAAQVGLVAVHGMPLAPDGFTESAITNFHRHGRALVAEQCRPVVEAGVELGVRVVLKDPRTLLDEVAATEDASIVVVGARGTGPIEALLLGGVSGYMIQHSDRVVAVIPRGAQ